MNRENPLLHKMKEKGLRKTKARFFIADVLTKQIEPQSVPDLLASIPSEDVSLNKTTLYRELELLEYLGIVNSVVFPDGTKRYEANNHHHHHVMCSQCKAVTEIQDRSIERNLDTIQKQIADKLHFRGIVHHLEFTGLCSSCSSPT